MRLKDQVALVTGGARGIGKQIALTLAKEGAHIVIFDVNMDEAAKTQGEIEALGRQTLAFKADVTDSKQVEESIIKILDKFKRVDILVNNAGITRDALLLRMTDSDWDAVINVNLKGTFICTKYVSKVMIKQVYGRIINIASISGLIGNVGQANYSASKAGIIALTKTAAKELARRNINVNAIAPGFISTDMTAKLPEEIKAKMLSFIALNRFGEAQDIANLCLFLASQDSSYITGKVIVVDGGMVM
jgi:3-oxoacyl-[acyl-carrier protein] reductase